MNNKIGNNNIYIIIVAVVIFGIGNQSLSYQISVCPDSMMQTAQNVLD